jgi:hypothetical protein
VETGDLPRSRPHKAEVIERTTNLDHRILNTTGINLLVALYTL